LAPERELRPITTTRRGMRLAARGFLETKA
jgi:hypothetical protein